jgi:hypothetical protein
MNRKRRKIRRVLKICGAWKEYKMMTGYKLPSENISRDFMFYKSPSGYEYWNKIKNFIECI